MCKTSTIYLLKRKVNNNTSLNLNKLIAPTNYFTLNVLVLHHFSLKLTKLSSANSFTINFFFFCFYPHKHIFERQLVVKIYVYQKKKTLIKF